MLDHTGSTNSAADFAVVRGWDYERHGFLHHDTYDNTLILQCQLPIARWSICVAGADLTSQPPATQTPQQHFLATKRSPVEILEI